MRLIVAFIFIFIWGSACAPVIKHQKEYGKSDYSKPYNKKSPQISIRGKNKKPNTLKSLSPFISKNYLAPTILNKKDQTLMILIDQGKYFFVAKKIVENMLRKD